MRRRSSTATEIWCGACREMHPRSSFGKDRNSPDGLTYACNKVIKERNRRSHAKNREANNRRHRHLRRQRKLSDQRVEWALKKLLSDAKRRARAKGLEFDLSPADLPTPERCPVFGVKLIYQADGQRQPNSASLDRIDSNCGYTSENVWVISWRANNIKSDATPEELWAVANAVKTHAGRTLDGVEHNGFPEPSDALV